MIVLIAMMLAFFEASQGAAQLQNGSIEGRIIRASNAEPISGVQVVLVPPAPSVPPTAAGAPATPPAPTQIQLVRTPDGNAQIIQTGPGGTVVTPVTAAQLASGNLPIPGAPAVPQITAMTDSDGKFSFQNLAPGQYNLRAQRQGYFGPMTPQGQYPVGVTRPITIEANVTARVELGMVQGGVLRGVVRDPDGELAPNYAVVTARPGYNNMGRAVWILTGALNADDRGEYRWPNFAPGEYYVGVGPRAPGPIANIQDSWARVFYPGVIDPNLARPVTIAEGAELTVNLAAQVKPWGSFKISGVAVNPLPNLVPDPATGMVNRSVSLVLMPYDLTPLDNPPVTMWTNLVATNTKPNGEFVLSNVGPGRYELYAMATDVQNRRVWTGHIPVEVKDKDITGLSLTVSPGVTLKGEIAVTGAGSALRPEMVRIQLQSLGTLPPQIGMAVGAVPFDTSGKFEIANLAEGRYRMNVQVPPGAYVASIQHGSVNVFDEGFELDGQSAQLPIRVEVNTAGETVEGHVRAAGPRDAPNTMVVLVPASNRRMNPMLYKTGVTDDKGHFIIRGVAPGSYTAFAWESVLPFAYQNAEFLAKYQTRGRTINVQTGSPNDLQLELIQGN